MPYVTEQNLTDVVRERWSDIPDPRLKQVMTVADQAPARLRARHRADRRPNGRRRSISLTRTGQMCDDKRQEFILMSDVLGVSMLVDAINHRRPSGATPSTVEGPFHIPDAPAVANGGDMAKGAPGIPCFVVGKVRDLDGKPGLRRHARPVADRRRGPLRGAARRDRGPWMRGLYRSQPDGSYLIRTVAPIAYTIPMDGTDRRTDEPHQHQPHAAGAHPLRPQRAGLSRPGDASVPGRRRSSSRPTWSMA